MSHYKAIQRVIEKLVEKRQQSLEELASSLNMSPEHLQRLFVDWVGISPKQLSRYLSLEHAKQILQESNTLNTSLKSGLSSSGRLHDLFVDIQAMTPGEYKNGGAALTFSYVTFETSFGPVLVVATTRGVSNISFYQDLQQELVLLKRTWPRAEWVNQETPFHVQIRDYFLNFSPKSKIKLHLHGTNFQIKVWEALLSIPEGQLASYGAIAQQLGGKNLSRAVGSAVGDNPVAHIIPCHRVLRATGEIGGYHWGLGKKRAMLLHEAIRAD